MADMGDEPTCLVLSSSEHNQEAQGQSRNVELGPILKGLYSDIGEVAHHQFFEKENSQGTYSGKFHDQHKRV